MSTTPSRSFDPATVSRGTWVAAGGSLILLISVFMSWYGVGPISINGWDATDWAKLIALLALAGLVVIGLELFAANVTIPYPSSLILIGIGALSTLLVLFRIVSKPGGAFSGALDLKYGIFVALIAAIAIAVGGYLKMSEA